MRSDIETVAADWPTRVLGDVASITLGGTPSTLVPAFWGGSLRWMASGDVNLRHVWDVRGRITEAGLASSNATLVDPPAVAVGLAGQGKTRGTVALVHVRLCTNQSIALLRGEDGVLDTTYLFHNLEARYEELRARSSGGGRGGLSRQVLARVPLYLPSVSDQRRISEILETADKTLADTDALIRKLEAVRVGLADDLLRRGIDSSGELRDPEAHPESFRMTAIGRLPRDWRVVRLGEVITGGNGVIQTGPFGSQLHAREYVTDGIPVVMPQDMNSDGLDDTRVARIAPARARDLRRHQMISNDLVVGRRGDLSRCAPISPLEEGWVCGTGCLLVRPPRNLIDARWLAAVYRHEVAQRQIRASAVGSTMVNLNTQILGNLMVPIPPLDEQQEAAQRLVRLSDRLREERSLLEKLTHVKSGLRRDLLSGRVRVSQPAHVVTA